MRIFSCRVQHDNGSQASQRGVRHRATAHTHHVRKQCQVRPSQTENTVVVSYCSHMQSLESWIRGVQIVYRVLFLESSPLALPAALGLLMRRLCSPVLLLRCAQLAHCPFPEHIHDPHQWSTKHANETTRIAGAAGHGSREVSCVAYMSATTAFFPACAAATSSLHRLHAASSAAAACRSFS